MGSGVHPSAIVLYKEPAYGDNLSYAAKCSFWDQRLRRYSPLETIVPNSPSCKKA